MALGISERNEIDALQRRVACLEAVIEELGFAEKAEEKRAAREARARQEAIEAAAKAAKAEKAA